MKSNILCLMLGVVLVGLLFASCGKEATTEKETLSTKAQVTPSEEEIEASETIANVTSESEITIEKRTTTVKQEETTMKKEEGTTTKKEEATTTNKQEVTTTKKQETTAKNQNTKGLSYARTYTKSEDYEILDYWPGVYGWKAIEFWWEPVQWYGTPLKFEWALFCWSDKYGDYKFDEMKGNILECMPSYPDYELSNEIYNNTDDFMIRTPYEITYNVTWNGKTFIYTTNKEYIQYGKTTLYYRDKNNETGFGLKCPLIKNDEDVCNYINEIMKNGYTEISYRHEYENSPFQRLQECLMLCGIDLAQWEYAVEYDSYYIGDGYEAYYERYEKCPYTKCKELYSAKELKEYICYCFENGIKETNVYVIDNDFSWGDFVSGIKDELYIKYEGKVSSKLITYLGGGEVWSYTCDYGTSYKYQERTFLSIELSEADENYE